MKHPYLISFILVLTITSCKNSLPENSKVINIDIGKILSDFKEVKSSSVTYVPLSIPDSIFFGGIDYIKVYDNMIFLHDEGQTNSVTITDKDGKYINQLKKVGNAPGEYGSLDAFAYDEANEILSIYDRSKLSIYHYTFPDLHPINNFSINRYIMNMEYIDDKTIIIFSENEINQKGKYEGVLYISNEGEPIRSDFPIGNDVSSIELSYPNTAIKISDTTYYAHPHEITTIYKMGKIAEPIYKIDFGKNKIPKKFWPVEKASEFESSLTEGNKAVWVQNLILNEETISFSFLYKEPSIRHFYLLNRKDLSEIIYKEYRLNNSNYSLPYPIGSDGENYISLIYEENIDRSLIRDQDFLKALDKSESVGGYVLAIYKP